MIAVDSGDPPNPEIAHVAALSPDRRRPDRQPEADPADGGGGGLDDVLFDPLARMDGAPVCPQCRLPTCWACPRPNGAPRFRCSACRRDFSPTSGTLFAFHKLEIRDYLAAVVIFCDEVKGKAALALSRDLDVQYKTAFVLAHKIREAMASEVKSLRLGGLGRHVEIDGCYVGGHVRPANRKADRKDRRLAENRSGRRQVVVVIQECALSRHQPGRHLARRVCQRGRSCQLHQSPGRSCLDGSCRQVLGLERAACPVRHPADQPLGRVRQ